MQSLSKKFYKLLRTLPCIFRIFNKYFLYPNPQTDSNYQFVLPIEEEYNKSNQIPCLSPKQKNLPVGQTGGSLAFAILFVTINWCIGYQLYKRKIYIKI